jgi:hypothetical protein
MKHAGNRALLHVCFFLGLFFHAKDGSDILLRNIGRFSNTLQGVISEKI